MEYVPSGFRGDPGVDHTPMDTIAMVTAAANVRPPPPPPPPPPPLPPHRLRKRGAPFPGVVLARALTGAGGAESPPPPPRARRSRTWC